ncbi:MAG: hypothetical protein IMY79_01030 [Chloroflexi bacterium]|nr:hypothetical protein [Chloroflexota bacterium]
MPEDKDKCLSIIDQYLALPDEERLNFRFGKRAGYYDTLADLADQPIHEKIDEAIRRLKADDGNAEEALFRLKNTFI